jgi:hypothetical protein
MICNSVLRGFGSGSGKGAAQTHPIDANYFVIVTYSLLPFTIVVPHTPKMDGGEGHDGIFLS